MSQLGYYDWLGRPPSLREEENTLLGKLIEKIYDDSPKTYGPPRVHAELVLGLGMPANHKRVAWLMREAGIQGLYRRRNRRGPPGPATEDDLVHRKSAVDAPDRLWLTDIERHEALLNRVEVGDLDRRALAAARRSWGQPDPRDGVGAVSSPDNDEAGQYCQMVRARQARRKGAREEPAG